MSDLIRREDVIAVLCFCEETKMMLCKDLRKILEKINALPSAEPELTAKVEKIHMEYASEGDFDIYECGDCGNCGETVMRGDKFCHECGARLEWK